MSEEEAGTLLESKIKETSQYSRQLARALDCMPLAITQAAAYIRERAPRCTVQQYLQELESSRDPRIRLLNRHIPLPDRDGEAMNSVLLIWQISFDHIRGTRRSAAELLSTMSFCDRLAIPEILLHPIGDSDQLHNSQGDFEEDLVMLRNFSFISVTTNAQVWEMHRLVQDATQVWLDGHGRLIEVLDAFLHRLNEIFPKGAYKNLPVCHELMPHVKSVVEHRPTSQDALLAWASVLYEAARYLTVIGSPADAHALATIAMDVRMVQLGENDSATLESMSMVAATHYFLGQWSKARELQMKTFKMKMTELGPHHPETLAEVNILLLMLYDHGCVEEKRVEELQKLVTDRAMELGWPERPHTLMSMTSLAIALHRQGRLEEAIKLHEEVTRTTMKVFGPEHPNTLASMIFLAYALQEQGRFQEAENLQTKVMHTKIKVYGPEHADTLMSMSDLATVLQRQDRSEEAKKLQTKVMDMLMMMYGLENSRTLTSMENLALTLCQQGRLKEAEAIEVKVVETRRRMLGSGHSDTLSAMENLAAIYSRQGRSEEAGGMQIQAAAGLKNLHNIQHPETKKAIMNLRARQSWRGQATSTDRVEDQSPISDSWQHKDNCEGGEKTPAQSTSKSGWLWKDGFLVWRRSK